MLQFIKGEFREARNGTAGKLAKLVEQIPRDDDGMKELGYARQTLYGTSILYTRRTPERVQRVLWNGYLPAIYTEDEADFMELTIRIGLAQRLIQA